MTCNYTAALIGILASILWYESNNGSAVTFLQFVQSNGANILKQSHDTKYIAVKFLILALSLDLELHRTKERAIEYGKKARTDIANAFPGIVGGLSLIEGVFEKLVDKFLYLLVISIIPLPAMMW